jgi:hypothetical protein
MFFYRIWLRYSPKLQHSIPEAGRSQLKYNVQGPVCNNYNFVSVTVLYGSPLFFYWKIPRMPCSKFLKVQMPLCLPYGIKVYLRCNRLRFLMHSSPLTASCSTIFAIPMARNGRGFAKQGWFAAESLTSIWGFPWVH